MKFSIQEEDGEKQYFLSFQDAAKKTGINPLSIVRILRSDKDYFRRRSDKKVIFIRREEDEPFIQIDGEDFNTFEEINEKFRLRRQVFYKQLLAQGGKYFLDDFGQLHKVTKRSDLLERFIDEYRKEKMYKGIATLKRNCKKGSRIFTTS